MFSIRFKQTRSKLYQNCVNIMIGLPNYSYIDGYHSIKINHILEFIKYRRLIDYLLQNIIKWKTCEVILYGQKLTNPYYRNILEDKVGKYWELFSWEGNIDYEDLPLPFVHYPESGLGSFIGFSEDIDSQIYFCECQRTPIENYIKLREQPTSIRFGSSRSNPLGSESFPSIISEQSINWKHPLINHIHFKEGLCFRCNNIVPNKNFSEVGTEFIKKYGWYVMEEYYSLGIDQLRKVVLPEYSNEEIYCLMRDYFEQCSHQREKIKDISSNIDLSYDDKTQQYRYLKSIDCPDHRRIIENIVREKMGFRKIGDGWVNETMLYNIVSNIFKDEDIIRHFRPQWLDKLELDIYIPNRKLGFEYQGIQHYKPVEHWGGEEGFKIVQEHDRRKKELCITNNITLICIDYNEPLTERYIKNRINEVYKWD